MGSESYTKDELYRKVANQKQRIEELEKRLFAHQAFVKENIELQAEVERLKVELSESEQESEGNHYKWVANGIMLDEARQENRRLREALKKECQCDALTDARVDGICRFCAALEGEE